MSTARQYVNRENVENISSALAGRRVTSPIFPSVYIIDPASVCNINCVMCPNNKMKAEDKGFIDLELFKRIVDDISPYAEFLMLYWMGETLLHPDLVELLEYARSRIRGKIVVSTNMTIFDEKKYDALAQCCDIIICSLDRWDREAYEKIRIGASFDAVVSNINQLLSICRAEGRAEVVVKALDLRHDDVEYQEFDRYWSKRGARSLFAWLNDWAGTFSGMRSAASLPIPREEGARAPCADLWFKMAMNWRGEVLLCCFDWRYAHQLSVVSVDPWLEAAWNGPAIERMRNLHLKGDFSTEAFCGSCNSWAEPREHRAYVDWNESSYFTVF